jgi:hypothetical protein
MVLAPTVGPHGLRALRGPHSSSVLKLHGLATTAAAAKYEDVDAEPSPGMTMTR